MYSLSVCVASSSSSSKQQKDPSAYVPELLVEVVVVVVEETGGGVLQPCLVACLALPSLVCSGVCLLTDGVACCVWCKWLCFLYTCKLCCLVTTYNKWDPQTL
ncbi:hypothetical protein Pcinc_012947 [Petrolisthes cinctipes]|uniref:Uncharacterized protein n=1 Tax=Petrolisthes cinctipes TaxID=88211 RepID=A0AAE1KUU2_PETCI|nr:hypothetical protein Pcinc_012947 [Petrolisthes cinctipes]